MNLALNWLLLILNKFKIASRRLIYAARMVIDSGAPLTDMIGDDH